MGGGRADKKIQRAAYARLADIQERVSNAVYRGQVGPLYGVIKEFNAYFGGNQDFSGKDSVCGPTSETSVSK